MSISEMFLEIDRERFKLALLSSIVNVVLVFLVLNYVFTLFRVHIIANVALSAAVFYVSMYLYMKKFDVPSLKKRDPKTEEMLKTARDNAKEDNIVVSEFFRQVGERAKDVSFSDLLSLRSLTVRLVLIVVVAVFSVLVPAPMLAPQLSFGSLFPAHDTGISVADKSDVLDSPKALDLQDLPINIQPSNNELDFSRIKEPEQKNFARNPFPTQAEAVSDTPFDEKAPEDFELIKEYNIAIHEQG